MSRPADEDVGLGGRLHALAARLFPICRSMTGNGVRETLDILRAVIPVETREIPTGTQVFDWTVPPEWNIRDAYVETANGLRVIDFQASNLHVVNGSQPVRRTMKWSELKRHIHTLPDQPDFIPFRTCHFKEEWGFCVSQHQFDILDSRGETSYEVVIDASLEPGSLTYGEYYLEGKCADEVLVWTHICHPSLANDGLSGVCVATELARALADCPERKLSYRFVFAPATIGAITWLAQNRARLDRIKHGLVLSLLGDKGHMTYKQSRQGDAQIDRVAEHVLANSGDPHEIREFVPFGYDERQFCSPGINLPMGCLMRTPNGEFPEYHTSGDNLDFIRPQALADSTLKCLEIFEVLEHNETFLNTKPHCEPRLGHYGLYKSLPSIECHKRFQEAVQWVLNLSDGESSLLDIAERSKMTFAEIRSATAALTKCGLLEPVEILPHSGRSCGGGGAVRHVSGVGVGRRSSRRTVARQASRTAMRTEIQRSQSGSGTLEPSWSGDGTGFARKG